ncbi:MAG: spore germination protein [Clostridia bacterium]|nr:spore germination protein [Clostridia bacterium]
MVRRDFLIGGRLKGALIYIDGLADTAIIEEALIPHLLGAEIPPELFARQAPEDLVDLMERALPMGDVRLVKSMAEVVEHVLSGDTAIFVDGHSQALVTSTRAFEHRGVEEPITESVVRGPREGFVENLRANTALIRRRLKTPDLKVESFRIGRYSATAVYVIYLSSLADPALIREVRRRLERIDVDGILESAYIEELIEDNPASPFPQIDHTERPDKVAASLLEGRAAILIDNTPFVLLVPAVFVQFIQSSEDYYERFYLASFLRMARFIALNIALILPAVYVAVSTFHQEMLPTSLLIKLAAQREGVPFPAVIEALLLELAFEMLREAGVRLPRPVGQAVSIVGALVIGEAAVNAGLVSAAMVIVVALTGIASFALPYFAMAITIRLLRFVLLVAAGILGFYGIMIVLLVILVHLCALRSFGVPYLSPVSPYRLQDWKDVFVRAPRWAQDTRPSRIGYRDITRQGKEQRPGPREDGRQ